MFKIDPNTLYSKDDIHRELGEAMTVETFLNRLQPRKLFKNLYRGKDLLDAWERCLSEDTKVQPFLNGKEVKRNAKGHPQENRIRLDKVLARA